MDSGPLPCCSNKKYHNMFGAIATGGVCVALSREGCTMKEVILELIEQGRYAEVRNKIAEMNEVDIAQIWKRRTSISCW